MNQWVVDNIATVIAVFGLLITVAIFIVPYLTSRDGRAFKAALTAKDATIELLNSRIDEMSKEKSEHDIYKSQAEKHSAIMDETIAQLHKRISDLETNQFFTLEGNSVILKSKGLSTTKE